MKVLIIEDNPGAARLMRSYVEDYPGQAEVAGIAHNYAEALAQIRQSRPDLLLMDIQLEDRNAFDLLNELDESDKASLSVIIVTAYFESQYLYRALKISAIDYITKPVSKEALFKALDVVIDRIDDTSLDTRLERLESAVKQLQEAATVAQIPVHRVDGSIDFTSVDDLDFISTEHHITRLHYGKETISTTRSLKYYLDLLKDDKNFYRGSKQAIIHLRNINKYIHKERRIIMQSGNEIHVSRRRSVDLLRIMSSGTRT